MTKEQVINKLEIIFEKVLKDLALNDEVTITLRPLFQQPSQHRGNESSICKRGKRAAYPGSKEYEAWRFTVVVKVLGFVHQALVNDIVTTKRNIYYQDPELFESQNVVDNVVDNLAQTLQVRRADLNVVASPKGLVVGSFTIIREDGFLQDVSVEPHGVVIPNLRPGDLLDVSGIAWVLVVEKEACFRELINAGYLSVIPRKGLIITAKGYPDVSTRTFLHRLRQEDQMISFYCLVDWDPDGISIFVTYAYGSLRLAHESNTLVVPNMRYLGVKCHDVMSTSELGTISLHEGTDQPPTGYDYSTKVAEGALISLTHRDRKKAISTLERVALDRKVTREKDSCRRELQVMLFLNTKAEIQCLKDIQTNIKDHLMPQ